MAKNNENSEKEKSKIRIMKAATRLFAKKGFDGAGIREICKEANANICMISHFWGGKQELYNGIIETIISEQVEYAREFIDINANVKILSKKEQIDTLFLLLDKFIDFFYTKMSDDFVKLIIRNQENNKKFLKNSPIFNLFTTLLANIFENNSKDEIILKTAFILSQINSPRVLHIITKDITPNGFSDKHITIVKANVKLYINALLKEAQVV